jgi:hypothetical protein
VENDRLPSFQGAQMMWEVKSMKEIANSSRWEGIKNGNTSPALLLSAKALRRVV